MIGMGKLRITRARVLIQQDPKQATHAYVEVVHIIARCSKLVRVIALQIPPTHVTLSLGLE